MSKEKYPGIYTYKDVFVTGSHVIITFTYERTTRVAENVKKNPKVNVYKYFAPCTGEQQSIGW